MLHSPTPRFVSRLTKETLALVLAGGRGSRLKEMTMWRAKPAVPFGGKFRIIDFVLSNCINSGIRRVGVITQYKAHSLIKHIQNGWGFLRGEFGEFIELMPAQQRIQSSWYQGTADAIFQNLDIIRESRPKYVLILAGDHVYKMDYGPMVAEHVENEADLTVGCYEVPVDSASEFGVMSVDENNRILEFTEKPELPDSIPGHPDKALVSMGFYIFNADFLFDQVIKDQHDPFSEHDFGKNIIPKVVKSHRTFAYASMDPKTGEQNYWRDVGTLDAFWQANLELIGVEPELNLYDEEWPIWTYQTQAPPAKFIFDDEDRRGYAVDSMVSGGCIVSGAAITHSLLFSNVRVNEGSRVNDSVVLPDVTIGRDCTIKNAIIDRGCNIPDNTEIGVDISADKRRKFRVTSKGVVLVTPESFGQEIHRVL
ncbi:MAG TPA: glucose-1-phosphate adenylyltransferase [Gammaproteobacteria bacterium]|nr:glucose-1-phosphate adenylyltransferase [Gammaproteobacteria bacterium]